MHVSFNSHNPKSSSSSKSIFAYLSKENENKNDLTLLNNEHFFSNDFKLVSRNDSNYSKEDCIKAIDNNSSKNLKLNKESNYYVLNIAPSENELKHLKQKVIEILEVNEIYLLGDSTQDEIKFFEEQKNITLDILLKDYADNVMENYANEMNREVYVDLENLPSERKNNELNKLINSEFDSLLIERGLKQKEEKEYVSFEEYSVKAELDKGNIYTIYINELEQEIDLFVPKNYFINEDNQLKIENNYLKDKVDDIIYKNEELNKEITIDKENVIRNNEQDEKIKLSFVDSKINQKIEFEVLKSGIKFNESNQILINQSQFNNQYNEALINKCKLIYKEEFKNISAKVLKENSDKPKLIQNKIIKNEFVKILERKGIMNNPHDQKFKINAEIVKEKANSSLISVKIKGKDEVRLLVNNNTISSINKEANKITFKNKREIEKLIDKAILRNKEENKPVEIKFINKEIISEKVKGKSEEKNQNVVVFKQEIKGLKELVTIKVLEKDLIKENGKYFLPKYQLDYKLKNEIDKGIKKEYQEVKQEIKNKVWRENGFNPETRKMTKNDLLYFGKVENQRFYKGSNKLDKQKIETNKEIEAKIKAILEKTEGKETKEIQTLKSQLIRDKHTGEVVKEGVQKGGNQKHIHIVVSRYDNTNPKHLKNSMSPVTNHRGNEQTKGFTRDTFFKEVEKIFDKRYDYSRPVEQSYEYRNNVSKQVIGNVQGQVKGKVIQEIKSLIKESGIVNPIEQVKQEFNPIYKLKQELPFFPLPTSLPKTKVELLFKIGKYLTKSISQGMKM